MEELRTKLVDCAGMATSPAVADAADDGNAESDPMAALVELVDPEGPDVTNKKKRLKRTPKGYIVELNLEQGDPTRHPDCTARRNVRLIAQSTNSFWLSLAHQSACRCGKHWRRASVSHAPFDGELARSRGC